MTDTVYGMFCKAAAARPAGAEAAVFPSERATYRELDERSRAAARRLAGIGVRQGDLVGVLVPANVEHLAVLLGAMRIGAVPVPINARYKASELDYVVRHSQMTALLSTAESRPLVEATGVETARVVVLGEDPEWDAADADDEPLAAAVAPEDSAIVLYTSGTTSSPKGAVHTHSSLVAEGHNLATRLELGAEDRFWSPLPMFHCGGIVTMLANFAVGAAFCHVGFFEPGAALHQLEAERCTHAFPAFETIWLGVLDHPRFGEADLSALRVVINVGVRERLKSMQERLPTAAQVSCFGSTESCGFMCLGRPDDPLESRLTTSGKPVPGMELRAISLDTGADAAPGEVGEAWFRGVSRFSHYHRDAQYTASVIDADGWFHSGDLIRIDAEGRVSFVQRLKDMLKVGGENVAAAEIEDYLAQHPAVKIVQVVAAPDSRYVEVPAAFVELRRGESATERDLIEFCLGKIATFKVPRYVRFVDEWPMSGTKVQKFRLRERIARELDEAGITEAPRLGVPAS